MEIMFFFFSFAFLYVYEKSMTIQPAQWTKGLPDVHKDWSQYETPSFQRKGTKSSALQKGVQIKKKSAAVANKKSAA